MYDTLLIGDPHAKQQQLGLITEFIEKLNSVIAKGSYKRIIMLGDFFHTHAVVRSEVLKIFKDHVEFALQYCDEYIYILGNHDMFKPDDSKYHALQSFNIPGLRVIDEIVHEDRWTFVPYIPKHEDFPMQTNEICIAHQQFIGCDYGYYRPGVGVDADNVSASIIISGHIHKRQTFGTVVYPGSPYAQSVNDAGEEKGLMEFNSDTLEYRFTQLDMPTWRVLEYELEKGFTTTMLHEHLVNTINNKDSWIVSISGPKTEISAYIKSEEIKSIRDSYHIEFRTKFTDNNKERIKIEALTIDSIIDEYLEKVYDGNLPLEDIKSAISGLK